MPSQIYEAASNGAVYGTGAGGARDLARHRVDQASPTLHLSPTAASPAMNAACRHGYVHARAPNALACFALTFGRPQTDRVPSQLSLRCVEAQRTLHAALTITRTRECKAPLGTRGHVERWLLRPHSGARHAGRQAQRAARPKKQLLLLLLLLLLPTPPPISCAPPWAPPTRRAG